MSNLEQRLHELALEAEGAPMSEHDEEVAAALREAADTLVAVRRIASNKGYTAAYDVQADILAELGSDADE